MNGCIAGWCMENGQSASTSDIYQDPRMLAAVYRPAFVRSLAVAPVGSGEPIAALGAYWAETHQPQPEELTRLQAIADATGLAMASLQRRNVSDPLTDVQARPNRDHAPFGPALEDFLHRGLRSNSPPAFAFSICCVLVATLLGLSVQASGIEVFSVSAFFYPAVLLALIVGGTWPGALAALLGGFAFNFFLMEPRWTFAPLTTANVVDLAIYAGSSGLMILTVRSYKRMVQRLKTEDARHLILALEIQHRARNAVAVIEAIVRGSLGVGSTQARDISQRIRAAFAEIDIHLRPRPIHMSKLLTQELAPFDLARFDLEGDDEAALPPEVSSILTLAAHELATNALKYGALSVPEGMVTVRWGITADLVTMHWLETGGPPVLTPGRPGYGSIMLRRLVEANGGKLVSEFPSSGATVEISLALRGT